MSKVVKVQDGDYQVVTQLGGNIVLNTGPNIGLTTITGDLLVQGTTTTISSETLAISDRVLYLNVGETLAGVGGGTDFSGFTVERGLLQDASFVFDENLSFTTPTGTIIDGAFTLRNSAGTLLGLQVSSLFTGGSNLEINTGTGVISVNSSNDYSANVAAAGPNAIPNKGYVQTYVLDLIAEAPIAGFRKYNGLTPLDTSGIAFDTGAGDAESKIVFTIDGTVEATVNTSGLLVNKIQLGGTSGYEINTTIGFPLTIKSNTNLVDIDSVLSLSDQSVVPSSAAGKNKMYSQATQGPGATGLFFTNTTTSDELVSRRRSLVFSMIF
jgi:hypothetical protein